MNELFEIVLYALACPVVLPLIIDEEAHNEKQDLQFDKNSRRDSRSCYCFHHGYMHELKSS